MKIRKLFAVLTSGVILSLGIFSGAPASLPTGAVSTHTYGDLIYKNYGEWIEITDCEETAEIIQIPNQIDGTVVRDIGDNAFEECYSLTRITVPDSVQTIGNYAFSNCFSLEGIELNTNLKTIGSHAFSGCSSLSNITIPNTVETIESYAFRDSKLSTITIPESVSVLKSSAFMECSNLQEIIVRDGNPYFSSVNGILFDYNQTNLLCYPAGKIDTTYTIPGNVVTIGVSSFYGCSNLTEIIIPNTVTTIEEWAFYYCHNLVQIKIPNSVQSIGKSAFYGCKNMSSVYIPIAVIEIKNRAFGQCTALSDVYYTGSETEWNNIEIDETMNGNSYLIEANIHYGTTRTNTGLLGDANLDGKVDVDDVVMLQKWLLCAGDLTCWQNVDLCEDGVIDAFDLCMLRRVIAVKEEVYPVENPKVIDEFNPSTTTLEQDFADDMVIVWMKHQYSVFNQEWSAEYFDVSNISSIRDATATTWDEARIQEYWNKPGVIFRQCIIISLEDTGKENVLKMIKDIEAQNLIEIRSVDVSINYEWIDD